MFQKEEKEFGYVKPPRLAFNDPEAVEKYQSRLIVPEPDRFYTHGAGKPLLPALLTIPQLALVKLIGPSKEQLLKAQYYKRGDLVFVPMRLIQILSGLLSIVLVFKILGKNIDPQRAMLGALVFAIFPITIKYFPNLHHDSILVPFMLLAVYLVIMERYIGAGVAYGLALASKNIAIVLFPALIADIGIQAIQVWSEANAAAAFSLFRRKLASLAVMGAVATVTLVPFANPISYLEEILTPIISRPIDDRGENLKVWTVENIVGGDATLSPQLQFAQKFLYFKDVGFLFLVLAVFLAAQRSLTRPGKISLVLLILYLPMGSIFGVLLEYRTLVLIPFFVIVAAEIFRPRQLIWLTAITAVFAGIYLSDPSRTDADHKQYLGQDRTSSEQG